MKYVLSAIALTIAGCAGGIQWGVPTEQKIQAQLAPIVTALEQHAQAINAQGKLLEQLTGGSKEEKKVGVKVEG